MPCSRCITVTFAYKIHRRPKWVVPTDCWAGKMIKMTFMWKPSASHKPLADLSLCGHRLETRVSLLHYVAAEYFVFSSVNVSVEKKNSPCFRTLSRDLCVWKSIKSNPHFHSVTVLMHCTIWLLKHKNDG